MADQEYLFLIKYFPEYKETIEELKTKLEKLNFEIENGKEYKYNRQYVTKNGIATYTQKRKYKKKQSKDELEKKLVSMFISYLICLDTLQKNDFEQLKIILEKKFPGCFKRSKKIYYQKIKRIFEGQSDYPKYGITELRFFKTSGQ